MFNFATFASMLAALIVFALVAELWRAIVKVMLKRLLYSSRRLRLLIAASIASDKELGRWVGREENLDEVTR